MAIDDNTSYELTGAQVKDLASKVNEKAKLTMLYASASLDSATSLYSDSGYTTAVESQDVKAALGKGTVIIRDDNGVDYVLTSADINSGGSYQTVYNNNIYKIVYEYDDDTIMSVQVKEVQSKLTAGSNITISSNTISATDTTYSAFTGATSSVAGSAGLVPAPTTSDPNKFLKGDGTWATVSGGSSGLVLYADQSLHTPTSLTNICTDSGLTTTADPTDMIAIIDAGSSVVVKYSTDEAVVVTSYDDHTGMVPDTISFTGQFLSNWKTNSPEFIKFIYSNTMTTWSAEGADLPTKTSDLTNDGSDSTSTYVEADELATVATSGAYSDLSGTPSLAAVATSGSYTDLSNKPTIPTVNNATLTIQKNGSTVKTFTANASSDVTANITVPTGFSDLSGTVSTNQIAANAVTTGKLATSTWVNGSYASGFKASTNTSYKQNIQATIVGRMLYIRFGVSPSSGSFAKDTEYTFGSIPSTVNGTTVSGLCTSAKQNIPRFLCSGQYGMYGWCQLNGTNLSLSFNSSMGNSCGWMCGQLIIPIDY